MESLPNLTQEELTLCIPCGSCQTLSAFDPKLCLPYVEKDHDLADILLLTVIKDASHHPKKPESELMSTILNTYKLSAISLGEMKKYSVSLKSFAAALGMNAASFSLSLREPRHWFDTNSVQKRCYYYLYLWLNLPQKFREATLKPFEHFEENPVETMPKIKALIQVFVKEINANNINLDKFAGKILSQDCNSITLRNMILTPLPWELMSWKMKLQYAKIWFWLKQRATKRLQMLGLQEYPDTFQIARKVLLKLQYINVTELIQEVNKGLPVTVMNSLLYNPVDWAFANPNEKYLYLALMQWLGFNVGSKIENLDIEATEIATSSLEFVKENNITVTEFSEKVVKIPRAQVSLYFNSPISWHKANASLRSGLINASFWMNLEPQKRLEYFPGFEESVEICDDSLEEARKVIANIENLEETSYLDTQIIAETMKNELRKAGISLKNFAKLVKINRNYFATMLNTPLKWETCTKLQKQVYKTMKIWIEFRCQSGQNLPNNAVSERALKPINGPNQKPTEKKMKKQKRVKFTPQQRQYLLDYFRQNNRPNHEEKLAISKHLNLSMRTVMIFFCNRRTRLSQKE